MKRLALETATEICSVAWQDGDEEMVEWRTERPNAHSEMLFVYLNQLFQERGVRPDDIDEVLISGGPGAYTGLRIGAACVKGLLFGREIPLWSLGTLASMAAGVVYREQTTPDSSTPISQEGASESSGTSKSSKSSKSSESSGSSGSSGDPGKSGEGSSVRGSAGEVSGDPGPAGERATATVTGTIHAVVNARRKHLYYQSFTLERGRLKTAPPSVETLEEIDSRIQDGDRVVGTGIRRLSSFGRPGVTFEGTGAVSARNLLLARRGELFRDLFSREDAATYEPDYLTSWQPSSR